MMVEPVSILADCVGFVALFSFLSPLSYRVIIPFFFDISPVRPPITTQGVMVLPAVTHGMLEPSAVLVAFD